MDDKHVLETMGLIGPPPSQTEVLLMLAFVYCLYAIPTLIGFALLIRLWKGQNQVVAYVGLFAALLWTVWIIASTVAPYSFRMPYQMTALVSIGLYLSAIADWGRVLFKTRLMAVDGIVAAALVTTPALFILRFVEPG